MTVEQQALGECIDSSVLLPVLFVLSAACLGVFAAFPLPVLYDSCTRHPTMSPFSGDLSCRTAVAVPLRVRALFSRRTEDVPYEDPALNF